MRPTTRKHHSNGSSDGSTMVLGTVPLDNKSNGSNKDTASAQQQEEVCTVARVPPPQTTIKDLESLSEHLPTVCTRIFEQVGSQQLEATYQRCLRIDLLEAGITTVVLEPEFLLTYKSQVVGTRRADIYLELDSDETAIIELKAVDEMQLAHRKQLEYYLHHADVNKGYLINFPHDSSFPAVDDVSSFTMKLLWGLMKKVEHLLLGGASLRLRNTPAKRQVEVVEVTRKVMNANEMEQARKAKLEAPIPRFGVKANGEECAICIREGRFCRFHLDQKPSSQQPLAFQSA